MISRKYHRHLKHLTENLDENFLKYEDFVSNYFK
jgi:hypothetical protein